MFRRLLIAVIIVVSCTGKAFAAEPKATDVSNWVNTQVVPSLELRKPLGGDFTGTFNAIHFVTPQSKGELNFIYVGFEHQTTPSLWLSPQLGVVTGWAGYECVDLGLWAGWDITPKIQFFGDVELLAGGGLHDLFQHHELNYRFNGGKAGIHFEQVNRMQQIGPHVQFKHDGLALNLGVYAGSGSANGRIGLAYTLPPRVLIRRAARFGQAPLRAVSIYEIARFHLHFNVWIRFTLVLTQIFDETLDMFSTRFIKQGAKKSTISR